MNIQSSLEINFHQVDEVSILLQNTASGKEEKFGEVLLFCSFILRTLVNLGNHPAASAIAVSLSNKPIESMSLSPYGEPKIIDYSGAQSKKKFIANLKYTKDKFNFQFKAKGFGILARRIAYYAPSSIEVLAKYLKRRRQDDKEYIEILNKIAKQCGVIHRSGELKITNQSDIALMFSRENYIDGDDDK